MAKKDDDLDFDLDNLGLDNDLDSIMGDDSLSSGGGKKGDRNPVTSTLKNTAKGIADSIKGDPLKTATEIARNSIPKGITSEVDDLLDIHDTIKSEVKTAASDLRKAGYSSVSAVDRLLSDGSKIKKLTTKIKKLLASDEDSYNGKNTAQIQSDAIADAIAKTIGSVGGSSDSAIKEQLALNRHKSAQELQAGIYTSIDKIRRFQFEITNSYYRRSLELQYKSLFTSKEQLEVLKTGINTFKDQLDAIAKNTGLPDFVKLRASESIKGTFNSRMTNGALDVFFGSKSTGDKVKEKLTNTVNNVKSSIIESLLNTEELANNAYEFSDMASMMGGKANMAGGVIGEYLKSMAGDYVGDKISATKKGRNNIYNLKNMMMNPEGYFKAASRKQDYNSAGGRFKGDFLYTLASLTSDGRKGNSLHTFERENLDNAAVYDIRTKDSIVKIIPGLLAKIYGEVKTLRSATVKGGDNLATGNEVHYDTDTGTFKTVVQFKSSIKTDYKKKMATAIGIYLDSFIGRLTENGLKLTGVSRSDLSSGIIKYVLETGNTAPDMLLNSEFNLLTFMPTSMRPKLQKALMRVLARSRRDYYYLESVHYELKAIKENAPTLTSKLIDLQKSGLTGVVGSMGLMETDSVSGVSFVNRSKMSDFATRTAKGISQADITESLKSRKAFMDAAGIVEPKVAGKKRKHRYKTPKELLDEGLRRIGFDKNKFNDSVNSKIEEVSGYTPEEIYNTVHDKVTSAKDSMMHNAKIQSILNSMAIDKEDPRIKKLTSSQLYALLHSKAIDVNNTMDLKTHIAKVTNSKAYTAMRDKLSGINNSDVANNARNGFNTFKKTKLGDMHKNMRGRVSRLRDTFNPVQGPELPPSVDDNLTSLPPEEEAVLRTMYFDSPEYISGSVNNFEDYAKTFGVKVDTSNDGLRTRFGYAKAYVNKMKKRTSGYIADKLKELKESYKLRRIKKDEEDGQRTEYYNSDEYQAGLVTDFREWLRNKGLRNTPLITIPSLASILKKTREWDRKIFKAGARGIGKVFKLLPRLFKTGGSKGGSLMGKLGKLPLYAMDGLMSTVGLGFMGVNDGLPARAVKGAYGGIKNIFGKMFGMSSPDDDSGSIIDSILGKTRAGERAAPGFIKRTGSKIAGGLGTAAGYGSKAIKGTLGGIGGMLGSIFGKEPKPKHNVSEEFDKDGSGKRDGDWRDRLNLFGKKDKEHHDTPAGVKEDKSGGLMGMIMTGLGAIASIGMKLFKSLGNVPKLLKWIGEGIFKLPSLLGKFGATAWAAVKAGTGAIMDVGSKIVKKITPEAIKAGLGKLKTLITSRAAKIGGEGLAKKLLGKVATRLVPGLGMAMLAYDAAMVSKDMIQNNTPFLKAVSMQVLGFDVTDDSTPMSDDGVPVKPSDAAVADANKTNSTVKPATVSFMDNARSTLSNAYSYTSNAISSGVSAVSDFGNKVGNFLTGGGFTLTGIPAAKGKILSIIDNAAQKVGVDPGILKAIAGVESSFNPNSNIDKPNAHAKGLFQFMPDTWNKMIANNGSKYGFSEDVSIYDPDANATMGALYVRDNINILKSNGLPAGPTEVYLMHFLGSGGGPKFLKSPPDAIAADLFPKEARQNTGIFYDAKNGNKPRTISEVYNFLAFRLQAGAKAGGFQAGSSTLVNSMPPPAVNMTKPPTSAFGNTTIRGALGMGNNPSYSPNATKLTTAANTAVPVTTGTTTPVVPKSLSTSSSYTSPTADFKTTSYNNDVTANSDVLADMKSILLKSLEVQIRMADSLDIIANISNTNKQLDLDNANKPANRDTFPDPVIDLRRKTF
jgi:hypothetical protein